MENIYAFLHYIILGIIQGLTEPLPVSSSGHLRIASYYFGIDVPDLHLEVFLNFGSLLAVFIVYKKDITELIIGLFNYVKTKGKKGSESFRFTILLIVGTIPAAVIGAFFSDFFGGTMTSITIVAISLMITGVLLWLVRRMNGNREEEDMNIRDAAFIGIAQAAALAPGISRSGTTVVAALVSKIKPEVALKYSFFLSIPIGIGSFVFKWNDISANLFSSETMLLYGISFLTALVVSILAIKLFINVVTKGKLLYFAIYCFAVSVLILITNF